MKAVTLFKQRIVAMGVPVNGTDFDASTAMTEAMLTGNIARHCSQGLTPFINAARLWTTAAKPSTPDS